MCWSNRFLLPLLAAAFLTACGGGSELQGSGTGEGAAPKFAADRLEVAADAPQARALAAQEARGATQVMSELAAGTTLSNGNFESGTSGWSQSSTGGYKLISNFSQYAAYSGSQYAWLGGYNSGTDVLYQDVTVPASGTGAKLQFWYHITTNETAVYSEWDKLSIELVSPSSGAKLATLASFSNLSKTSGWTQSPQYDLTAYRGQTVRLRFTATVDATDSSSFRFDDISVFPTGTSTTTTTTGGSTGTTTSGGSSCTADPINGWWWNPAEGGRGFAIERQGNQLFAAAFLYEDDGSATWYVATLSQQGLQSNSSTYSGAITRYSGGQSLLGSYRAPTSTTQVGTAAITFSGNSNASLNVQFTDGTPAVTIALQRYPISSPGFAASSASFQNGWWWNESQGGRGFFIEVQGSTAFVGAFMYDESGQPTWYVSTANVSSSASSGTLQRYSGGQSLTGAYRSPSDNGTAGALNFSFSSATSGTMTLPDGSSVALKRYAFNGGSSCSSTGTTNTGSTTGTGTGTGTGNNTGSTTGSGSSGSTGSSGSSSGSTGSTTGIASFAGTYSVSGAGQSGSFNVNSSGQVTSCSVGRIVNCSGQLTLNGTSASFTITGNDGGSPIDTRATVSGTITASGSVSGSVSGTSVEEGPFSGSLSGSRSSSTASGGSGSAGSSGSSGGTGGTGTTSAASTPICDTTKRKIITPSSSIAGFTRGKADMGALLTLCKAQVPGLTSFMWGTDAGPGNGSAAGSCSQAIENAWDIKYVMTACYCYQDTSPGAASALSPNDWVCWVGWPG
mgnify:CR=1 FL=1